MTDQILLRQIQRLPDDLKAEVLNFIGYLLSKQKATQQHSKPMETERSAEEVVAAIRVVQQGCDMSSFGDPLEYQIDARRERSLPFRDQD
jgi:hypothetical protein